MTAGKTPEELSREAHEHIKPSIRDLQRTVLGYLVIAPGLTTNELASHFKLRDPRHIGRRLPEIVALGWARRGEPRVCTVTGRRASTWYPVSP